jgi:NAD-dependent deacetylase
MQISEELRRRFAHAKRVVVLTGAGVSAESGVISSAAMVERDLPAVWEWFDYRRGFMAAIQPNPAHYEIARWQERFAQFTLVTQNIDGLHQKAGSHDVIELHGNIWRARCTVCRFSHDNSSDVKRPDACLECGSFLRPDVVLFGEMLPPGARHNASCVSLSERQGWSIRPQGCRK